MCKNMMNKKKITHFVGSVENDLRTKINLEGKNIDIFFFSQTWLKENLNELNACHQISFEYVIIQLSWGGGIFLLAKTHFKTSFLFSHCFWTSVSYHSRKGQFILFASVILPIIREINWLNLCFQMNYNLQWFLLILFSRNFSIFSDLFFHSDCPIIPQIKKFFHVFNLKRFACKLRGKYGHIL